MIFGPPQSDAERKDLEAAWLEMGRRLDAWLEPGPVWRKKEEREVRELRYRAFVHARARFRAFLVGEPLPAGDGRRFTR